MSGNVGDSIRVNDTFEAANHFPALARPQRRRQEVEAPDPLPNGNLPTDDGRVQPPLLSHSPSNGGRPELTPLGRRRECHALDQLLQDVRAGMSRVLVLRGETGIGKSTLLEYLVARATGCRVARAFGVQSEMKLAYAGLHQLCAPALDLRESLPDPQRDSLATAFGLSARPAADPFVVGLGALGLLCALAAERPLICVVDDAQCLDNASASVLAFVARRLPAESIGLILAIREPNRTRAFAGLPEMPVDGLSESDARTLLASTLPGPLDERVQDRIVSECCGNPFKVLEVSRGSALADLAGGFALPSVMPFENEAQNLVQTLEKLPVETRRLVLLAAAEPLGDVNLLRRAAERLGVGGDAAAPARAAGLLDIGGVVRFPDPSVRSAVYWSASLTDRRTAHQALAETTDPDVDPDRRAWHLAHAADVPDENVAAEVESSARRAHARGGIAAAAAFLERATELTPDPARRGQRALNAAQAKLQAGGFGSAASILVAVDTGPLDALDRARIGLTRARIALAQGRDSEARPLLLAAARTLEPIDADLARRAYLDMLATAMFAGHVASETTLCEAAQAAREAPAATQPDQGDILLDALAVRFTDGYAAAAPLSRQAVRTFCDTDYSDEDGRRLLGPMSATAADLWDERRWDTLSTNHVNIARGAGLLSELPLALNSRAFVHLFAGELTEAASLIQEAQTVSDATGSELPPYGAIGLAAWQGRETDARRLTETTMSEVVIRADGIAKTVAHWASAVLSNSLGRYQDALASAREAAKCQGPVSASNLASVELIEAAARSGATEVATDALERLTATTRSSGTDWALGIEARSRALLSKPAAAEQLYREAIERLGSTRMRVDLARARLLYGEWLRREGRRVVAREELRIAHEMFTEMATEAFAERTRRELLATGHRARRRVDETRADLTAQEAQIARLARDGLSNPQIGAQLFLSSRTVEWHLRKVFAKLGISSRRQLHAALPETVRATKL